MNPNSIERQVKLRPASNRNGTSILVTTGRTTYILHYSRVIKNVLGTRACSRLEEGREVSTRRISQNLLNKLIKEAKSFG